MSNSLKWEGSLTAKRDKNDNSVRYYRVTFMRYGVIVVDETFSPNAYSEAERFLHNVQRETPRVYGMPLRVGHPTADYLPVGVCFGLFYLGQNLYVRFGVSGKFSCDGLIRERFGIFERIDVAGGEANAVKAQNIAVDIRRKFYHSRDRLVDINDYAYGKWREQQPLSNITPPVAYVELAKSTDMPRWRPKRKASRKPQRRVVQGPAPKTVADKPYQPVLARVRSDGKRVWSTA